MELMKKLLSIFLSSLMLPLFAGGQIAQTQGINIWYETFGNSNDPAMLLIMGGCCQGTLWPEEFCHQIANEGLYVIRYDHRDTGDSTCFDFEKNPYDLGDMAQDALDLLDFLEIEKAHLFGLSMGGPIAGLMAKQSPERIQSIVLISTSPDFRPLNLALQKKDAEEGSLSRPTQEYLDFMAIFLENPPETHDEMLEARVETWKFLASSHLPFNEKRERELQAEFLERMRYPEGLVNHIKAISLSEELIRQAFCHLQVPVTIFHGTVDPIFPSDHGQALAEEMTNAKLLLVPNMGHGLHETCYSLYVEEIKSLLLDQEAKNCDHANK